MKATALLEKQHREVEDLFTTLEAGPPNEDLVEDLCLALTAHAMIEEEIFYPAARKFNKGLVLESIEEHELMAYAVKRVAHCDPERESFQARLKAAKEVVERHVQEEETELLPAMTEALEDEDEALGQRMEKRFMELKKLGYEGALVERKARRSHESERPTAAKASSNTQEKKPAARSNDRKGSSKSEGSNAKKVSQAHPRGA